MNYKKLARVCDSTSIEVGGLFDNGEVKGKIKEIITAEDGSKTVKIESQNEDGEIEDVEVAIEDSKKFKLIKDSEEFSKVWEEFEEKTEDFWESNNDEIVVRLSEELPEKEIKKYIKLYNDHYNGKPEFDLSIESLGDKKYRVSCPIHKVKDSFKDVFAKMGFKINEVDQDGDELIVYTDNGEDLIPGIPNKEEVEKWFKGEGLDIVYIDKNKFKVLKDLNKERLSDACEDYKFKVVYADPETGSKKEEIFGGKHALDAAHDFADNLTPGSYKITRVYDSKIQDDERDKFLQDLLLTGSAHCDKTGDWTIIENELYNNGNQVTFLPETVEGAIKEIEKQVEQKMNKVADDDSFYNPEQLYEESLNKPEHVHEPFKAVTEDAINEFLETGEAFVECSAEDAEEIARDIIFVLKGYSPEDTTIEFGWDYLENQGLLHIFGVVD